jgi:hypothetical protein
MHEEYNIYGKYGCWWEGGTGVSPEGNQCGECYPQWEDRCPHLEKYKEIEELIDVITCVDDNGYAYDNEGYEITGYANSSKIAEALYNASYRKQIECENITENHPVDEFICSKCGLIMRDCCRYEIDEDDGDEICYEFVFRHCPRCGAKVKGGE